MKAVVSLNSGSSSIKFALFTLDDAENPVRSAAGKIEKIGIEPSLVARRSDGTLLIERTWGDGAGLTHADLLKDLFSWALDHLEGRQVVGIGHRVVHGGIRFAEPRLAEDSLLKELETLSSLAPLHQPHNLAAIHAISAIAPELPQVVCFDTAFHHAKPAVAARFALPRALHDQGVRRYGFHGLSYEYVARRLRSIDPELASGRVIAAHLGNGASMCAMLDGRSIDTTMGFTALDGLVMGTRCGALDPGVVLHLQTQLGMDPEDIEDLLYRRSGLLGVSGVSSDMRILTADLGAEAQEAVELFIWRAARECGALAASLGGVDGLVFTAGIGENHADVRARICGRLTWLGLSLDTQANTANALCISSKDSLIKVLVIPTDEEQMIAEHTLAVLKNPVTGRLGLR